MIDTVSSPPPQQGQLSVPNFEKGGDQKKMSAWGDLKSSYHGYLLGESCYISCQKKNLKIKYGFEGLISNVDLGLF